MNPAGPRYTARGEFFLCIARALAVPDPDGAYNAFTRYLADDLAELGRELGYRIDDEIAALRASLNGMPDGLALLQLYAGLFLTPPVPVHLNAVVYLDDAVLGGSEFAMQQLYARHGLARRDDFRDLPGHVTAQLEFVSELFGRAAERMRAAAAMDALAHAAEARRFLAAFPHRWLPPMQAALARACRDRSLATPYLHLINVLRNAIEAEIAQDARHSADDVVASYPVGSTRGIGEPSAEDLAEIAVRLEAHGLSFDHVRARPEWSDEVFTRYCANLAAIAYD
ncbi:MAG: molecular chaperone TorD family protein [Dongiaceae bacterium]